MVFFRNALLFALLTFLTQIGGVVFLAAMGASRALNVSRPIVRLVIFLGMYVASTIVTNAVAPMFGRVPLPCFDSNAALQVRSPIFCALNRNYVTAGMQRAAEALSHHMAKAFPETVTLALDANFPFWDGFPLLPHLSHDDGRKLDIAFFYKRRTGDALVGRTRSPVGYFSFEQPKSGDPLPCAGRHDLLTFRWNLEFLQPLFPNWHLDAARTQEAILWLSSAGRQYGVEKIFVEPHLAKRLAVENPIVRFQGCRAARHDDHIHFQVVK